ncbi:MAG: restriction endonuclease, partial [Cyanobacteria bacterium M5B4]
MTTNQNTKNNTSLHIEGNLISGDYLADLITGSVKGQAPKDFDLSRTDKLADEIAMVWGEAKRLWANFRQIRSELEASSPGVSETRKFWVVPLLEYLGYQPVYKGEAEIVDGQTFAISHRAGIPLSQNSPSSSSPLSQNPPSYDNSL